MQYTRAQVSIQFVSARRKQVDRILEVPTKDAVLSAPSLSLDNWHT